MCGLRWGDRKKCRCERNLLYTPHPHSSGGAIHNECSLNNNSIFPKKETNNIGNRCICLDDCINNKYKFCQCFVFIGSSSRFQSSTNSEHRFSSPPAWISQHTDVATELYKGTLYRMMLHHVVVSQCNCFLSTNRKRQFSQEDSLSRNRTW